MDSTTATLIPAFNRYEHFIKIVEQCSDQEFPNIHVLLDGPKTEGDRNIQSLIVEKCEQLNLVVIRREQNVGLAVNITDGITTIFEFYEKVIVIEDDCLPRDGAKDWFVSSLLNFEHDNNIGAICGYMPFTGSSSLAVETLKLKRFVPWGWATWRTRWTGFKLDFLVNLDKEILESTKVLGEDVYNYLNMNDFRQNRMDIWSLSFIMHCHLNNRVFVYPKVNQIDNIGFDGTGIHSTETDVFSKSFQLHSFTADSIDYALIDLMEGNSKMMYYLKDTENV